MRINTLTTIVLAAALMTSPLVVASPSLAAYLHENRRVALETSPDPGFPISSIRSVGDGFVIEGVTLDMGPAYWETRLSLHTDADLNITKTERTPSQEQVCPQVSITGDHEISLVVRCSEVATNVYGSSFLINPDQNIRIAVAADGQLGYATLGFDARRDGVAATRTDDGGAIFAIATEDGQLVLLSIDARARLRWQLVAGSFDTRGSLRWAKQGQRLMLVRQQGTELLVDLVQAADGMTTPFAQRTIAANMQLGAASLDSENNIYTWMHHAEIDEGPLERMNAAGTVTFSQIARCMLDDAQANTPGDPAIFCGLASNGAHTHWFSLDDDGTHMYKAEGSATPHPAYHDNDNHIAALAVAPDGSSLIAVSPPISFGGVRPRLIRIGGAAGATPEPVTLSPAIHELLLPRFHDDYQGGFISAEWDADKFRFLRRFSALGDPSWRVPLLAGHGYVNVSRSQVCASGAGATAPGGPSETVIDCFRTDDGTPTLSALIENAQIGRAAIAAQTQGRAFVFVRDDPWPDTAMRLIEWRNDAASKRELARDYADPIAILDSADRLVVIDRTTSPKRFDRFNADGTREAATHLPDAINHLVDAKFDDQDRLWIIYTGHNSNSNQLARLDIRGQFVQPVHIAVAGNSIDRVINNAYGTLILVNQGESPQYFGDPGSALISIANDGALRWQYLASAEWPEPLGFEAGASRIDIVETALFPEPAWRMTRLDAQSGAILETHVLPTFLYRGYGRPHYRFSAEGQVDFVAQHGNELTFSSAGIAPAVAIGNVASALAGAWSIPSLRGQGLAFEYNAGAGMLSAAWYAHDPVTAGSVDHNALRWHTLLGMVPGSETFEMPMSIFENSGGAFDDVPTTTSAQVGLATLRVTGCDRMTLSYAIGDDQSAPRMFALQRASPRTRPCTLRLPNSAVSTTTPASYVPQTDLGGAWYEQRTSGQGLHIVVYPPAGANAQETLGLGWFTYDPTGSADEATQQHWFTASGRFDDATGQHASLTIYRTTGGDRETMPTRNTHRVGTATLERIDCDSATLTYHFDDTLVAAAFATRSRAVPLQRLGGCRHHVADD